MNLSDDDINKEILKTIQISSQENILLSNIEKFYKKNLVNTSEIINIMKGQSVISMRLIDYFVTNYSKKYRVNYKIKRNDIKENFNVFTSYKSQLKAYNKKYFDPFSRGNRIPLFFKDDCIITTIGQLNFFRWFYINKVHVFIESNLSKIENDLLENKNNLKKRKKKKKSTFIKEYKDKTPAIIQFKKLPKKIDKIQLVFD
tara:strand:- start:1770 stop:2372 length:603 start_codon:yes stop_codon:yes gene_type:complete